MYSDKNNKVPKNTRLKIKKENNQTHPIIKVCVFN